MRTFADLTGQTFGRLSVVGPAPNLGKARAWLCRCQCGTEKAIRSNHLMAGVIVSCGCRMREAAAENRNRHGLLKTNWFEYRVWAAIKTRCYNPKAQYFHLYGGRGIQMDERWRRDFAAFLADVGPRPSLAYSIDRIDSNKGYFPGNCRWATATTQARNTSRTRLTVDTAKAIRQLLAAGGAHKDIATQFGVSSATISHVASGRTWKGV